MNQYQKVIVVVTAANLLLLALFPPVFDTSILRHASRNFDSFVPLYAVLKSSRSIYWDLLVIEAIFVVTNGLAAWLVLEGQPDQRRGKRNFKQGLLIFGVIDFALILCFPPFEQYSTMIRFEVPYFDGFYFLLGDKMQRHFFVPLLYLECIMIAVNLLLLYLLFGVMDRNLSSTDAHLLELAHALPGDRLAQLSQTLESELKATAPETLPPASLQERHVGKGPDRRQSSNANYAGPERRAGLDRRKRPRDSGL